MMRSLAIFILFLLIGASIQAQTMEEKVAMYLETFLTESKTTISPSQLEETDWTTSDLMGQSKMSFDSKRKFKRENAGFQANSSKAKGSWYIHNEYLVLEIKKEKIPMYMLKNESEIMLVDEDQIDVLRELLTEASYKDGALKPYSYDEIFTFLNGFTLQNR